MVDIGNWEPENPLGLSLPISGPWPEPDFELIKRTADQKLADVDPIKAGLYAWGVYGVLVVANWAYYSDRFYSDYTLSKYGGSHLAFRTWWGMATLLRNFTKMAMWGTAGLFWVLSMIPIPFLTQLFAWVTTGLIIIESVRVLVQVVMGLFSFFADSWDAEYRYHNYWATDVYGFGLFKDHATGRDSQPDYFVLDFVLEATGILLQYAAYPMLQLGVSEGFKRIDELEAAEEKDEKKKGGSKKGGKKATEEKKEGGEPDEDGDW